MNRFQCSILLALMLIGMILVAIFGLLLLQSLPPPLPPEQITQTWVQEFALTNARTIEAIGTSVAATLRSP